MTAQSTALSEWERRAPLPCPTGYARSIRNNGYSAGGFNTLQQRRVVQAIREKLLPSREDSRS